MPISGPKISRVGTPPPQHYYHGATEDALAGAAGGAASIFDATQGNKLAHNIIVGVSVGVAVWLITRMIERGLGWK